MTETGPIPSFPEATTDIDEVVERAHAAHAWALEQGGLPVFTVFDRPDDFPDWVVVRLFLGDGRPTTFHFLAAELAKARRVLEGLGLTRMERSPHDSAYIVESWL